MRSKLDNIGKTCVFVGYVDDHSGDVYRFLNVNQVEYYEERYKVAEYNVETLQKET